MKQKNRLASRLHLITTIAFYGAALFAIYIVFSDLLIKPTPNFKTVPNHNYGYSVPVRIQLNTPGDSVLTYHNANDSEHGQVVTGKQYPHDYRKMFNEILKDTAYRKTITIDSLTVRDDSINLINSEFDNVTIFRADGYAVLNPKNFGFKLLLAIKDYLYLFALLCIFWFAKSFFKSLKNDFSFNRATSHKLLIIGNVILCYQVINWLLCIAIMQFYNRITVESLTSGIKHKIEMYTLYADTEFNLGLVILSLALIVISRLLDYGNDLQEENELTI